MEVPNGRSNRLAEAPKATAPNQIWVADITYIETQEGWLYLAGILDLYSRKIVGWAMSERIDTALVAAALSMALLHRKPAAKLLFHSDRGVQYASGDFRHALQAAMLVPSMTVAVHLQGLKISPPFALVYVKKWPPSICSTSVSWD